MKLSYSLLFFSVFFGTKLMAQSQVNGFVKERITKKPIENAYIYNLTNKEFSLTDFKGAFRISAAKNDVLVFAIEGFKPDTLLLINLQLITRNLEMEPTMLNTVSINDKRNIREQNGIMYKSCGLFNII